MIRARMYDAIIAGGGLVGTTLACALYDAGLRVAVVEALGSDDRPPGGYEERPIALSLGSRRILDALGLWPRLAAHASPIAHVHVSQAARAGITRLSAQRCGAPALGYVLTARVLADALAAALGERPGLEFVAPASASAVRAGATSITLIALAHGAERDLEARLVVAADGGRSRVRMLGGIEVRERDYRQVAVVANVTPREPHRDTAFERFTPDGPLALLPMTAGRCGVVWCVGNSQVDALLAFDDEAFAASLDERLGGRLGGFARVGARAAHPLALVRAAHPIGERIAAVGNAAHQLHPVAGQGFNLGLRDAACLAEVLCDAVRAGEDPGAGEVLARYAAWRRPDQAAITFATDALVDVFSNDSTLLGVARGAAMLALDVLPALKRGLATRAMGLAGRQPRLARGVPL